MQTTRANIIDSIISLVYFMRGSIQYNEMMNLSYYERQSISIFIKTRLEIEDKKMYPNY